MRGLLERSITRVDERMILLAPPKKAVPSVFDNVERSQTKHRGRLHEVQRVRGHIYSSDGAVDIHELSVDGRHRTPEDDTSWHVLMLNEDQTLNSCIWYLEHENSVAVEDLRARHCPAALRAESRDRFRKAVETEIATARKDGIKYAESGGWAVSKGSRCSTEGLVLALTAFALGNLCGGVLALSTATSRHKSSTILQRMGGSPLSIDGQEIPAYFDPRYKCVMEVLRFDSRRPNSKYLGLVQMLQEKLANVPVIAPTAAVQRLPVKPTRPFSVAVDSKKRATA
jgi:hypothetical protein